MAQPLSGYTPASDTTLAFFRKDVERTDRPQLESIMISRVALGEIIARIDWEAAAGARMYAKWMACFDAARKAEGWTELAAALASAPCDGCSEPNRCGCQRGAEVRDV